MSDPKKPPANPTVTRTQAEDAVRTLLAWAGEDPTREGLLDTPKRVVEAYGDWYSGYSEDPREFLARTVGTHLVGRALADPAFLYPGEPFMPVEFSVAAYRLGHSQVRPGYLLGPDRAAALFPDDPSAQEAVTDLRGGRPVLLTVSFSDGVRVSRKANVFGPGDPAPE